MTSRRSFLKTCSLVAAGALVPSFLSRRALAAEAFPLVETAEGRIRAMDTAGIQTFRGIRYGADTGGENRFMSPRKPGPIAGVYDAFGYGPAAPQMPGNPADAYTQAVNWDAHVKTGMSEDCLFLNVWTPALDQARRPVVVYIHGGGYTNGSGGFTFDGDPLARLGNVVVITVNHRLGVLGYLDLGGLANGQKFAASSSAGMLDLVQALHWVRDNVARFGGNPGNVTIMGQSGGGSKVSVLMAMPAAKGLFHKAVVQSGSAITLAPRDRGIAAAEALLSELKIAKERPEDLQKLPWTALLQAQANRGFSPVVDGSHIPRHPFDPDAPALSADVPMIIGYTREDAGLRGLNAAGLSEEALASWARNTYPDKAAAILAAYKKAYPTATPFQIQSRIRTDAGTRLRAVTQAKRKAALTRAPAFLYQFDWASPAFEGRFGAAHGVDLGLIMGNPRDGMAGNTAEGRKLAHALGSAVAAFAKTGNPACDPLPAWPAYDATKRPTLVFDAQSKVVEKLTSELMELWQG
jgi:para-nitrobenzyl esterase